MRSFRLWLLVLVVCPSSTDDVAGQDWPQWGGTPSRNNTSRGRNIPTDWNVGAFERSTGNWIKNEAKNIKWVARLGSQSYGNPVVASGKIYVGTNNKAQYLQRYPANVDLGVLLCFEEETGKFLWQHSNEKLPIGRVHDWPLQGVCSTPVIDGDRLWYVTNRSEVVCLDTEGFYDGVDDGPEIGTWIPVFDVGTSYAETLRDWQRIPPRLKYMLSEAGIAVSRSLSLRQAERENTWSLGRTRQVTSRLYEWVSFFEFHYSSGELSVLRTSNDEDVPPTKLLTLRDEMLHLGLNRGEINSSLRQVFEAYGVHLAEDYSVTTARDGQTWLLSDRAGHSGRNFRVRLKSPNRISAEMLLVPLNKQEADVVWRVDMINELGVSPHNMSNCSPLIVGNKLFVCTSNGLDSSHEHLPSTDAPSFLALDRETGQVLWSSKFPGNNILHAQWASPSYGVIRGQPQVIFPGGDGWVYSFDPEGDGRGGAKLLWKFDGNPKASKWIVGGRGTRNSIIAFPAICDGFVYITMGQDPEHGEGDGLMWCIDPAKRMDGSDVSAELAVDMKGNVIPHRRLQAVDPSRGEHAVPNPDSAVIWRYTEFDQNDDGMIDFEETFHRSIGIPAVKDNILYIADFSGLFHCIDAKTGEVHWTHDMLAAVWGSALVVDGKVYIGDEDGDISIFRHSADPNVAMKEIDGELFPINAREVEDDRYLVGDVLNMGNSLYMTPIVANNVLYIANRTHLFAIAEDGLGATRPRYIRNPCSR